MSVEGFDITVFRDNAMDYISLTDIAKSKEGDGRAADIIKNWVRNRGTIEFIGTWEQLHNPNFKVVEFDHFKMNAEFIHMQLSASDRLLKLNTIAIRQIKSLTASQRSIELK